MALPLAAQLPVSCVATLTLLTVLVHVRLRFGCAGAVTHVERVTLNVATHEFAAVGAVSNATVTPDCGLLTVNAKPLMLVVPAGRSAAIDTAVEIALLPEHVRLNVPITQELAAPGNNGDCVAAIAAVTVMPLTTFGAGLVHAHAVGQLVVPASLQLPASTTVVVVLGADAFQVRCRLGAAGVVPQLVRVERKIATQPFAAVGAWTCVTVTPVCGLVTAKAKPVMLVVPAGMRDDRFTGVSIVAEPAHTLSSEPRTQLLDALGKSGAAAAAMAVVTVMPLTVAGAVVSQLQVAGQFVEPDAVQLPVSWIVVLTVGTAASHVIVTAGAAGVLAQLVRVTEKVATHELAAVGALASATVTPVCGLVTVNWKFEMLVVPAGIWLAIDKAVVVALLPEQLRLSVPITHALTAPGNNGACVAAIVEVTVMPFTTFGAAAVHAHAVGQLVEPGSEQSPLSTTDKFVLGTLASKVTRTLGAAGWLVHTVRVAVNLMIQPLACVGACVIATATPACGLSTVKPRFASDVVPAGTREDRS